VPHSPSSAHHRAVLTPSLLSCSGQSGLEFGRRRVVGRSVGSSSSTSQKAQAEQPQAIGRAVLPPRRPRLGRFLCNLLRLVNSKPSNPPSQSPPPSGSPTQALLSTAAYPGAPRTRPARRGRFTWVSREQACGRRERLQRRRRLWRRRLGCAGRLARSRRTY
jgi:hypothetical protein